MYKPLIILLSLLSVSSVAQDWKLLNQDRIYYYSRSDSNGVTNSIRFDSVFQTGDTTVFVLIDNYLEPEDTCISTDEEVNMAPDNSFFDNIELYEPLELCNYFEINRGSIVGKEIIEMPNGDFVLNPGGRLIKSTAGLNDTWVFDSVSGETATVISIEQGIYIDTPDTLKTIYLSSGDTIVISKNFGLIQYPVGNGAYYHSEGVQGTGVGYTYPNFADVFYTFNVGDAFLWRFEDWIVDGTLIFGLGGSFKFEITGIDTTDNQLTYITDVCGNIYHYITFDSTVTESFQLVNYLYKPDSLFRAAYGYPGELSKYLLPCLKDVFPYWSCYSSGSTDLNSNVQIGLAGDLDIISYPDFIIELADSLKFIWKGLAYVFTVTKINSNLTTLSYVLPNHHVGVSDVMFENLSGGLDYREQLNFMEGVGLVGIISSGYPWERSVILGGFRKDGQVYGSMPNCTIVGVPEISKPESNINISPNPFKDEFKITNGDNITYRLEVFDILGRKIFETQIYKGSNSISLDEFRGNAFILRFISKNEVFTRKIIRGNQ